MGRVNLSVRRAAMPILYGAPVFWRGRWRRTWRSTTIPRSCPYSGNSAVNRKRQIPLHEIRRCRSRQQDGYAPIDVLPGADVDQRTSPSILRSRFQRDFVSNRHYSQLAPPDEGHHALPMKHRVRQRRSGRTKHGVTPASGSREPYSRRRSLAVSAIRSVVNRMSPGILSP